MPETKPPKALLKLAVPGAKIPDAGLPDWLASGPRLRGGETKADPFLPEGLVKVHYAVALTQPTRGLGDGAGLVEEEIHSGQIVVIEFVDGATVMLSPESLAAALPPGEKGELYRLDLAALSNATVVTRGAPGGVGLRLFSRLFVLDVDPEFIDEILEEAREKALRWARQKLKSVVSEKLWDITERGISWYATKALMGTIEGRIGITPGLYRWQGEENDSPSPWTPEEALLAQTATQPFLLFIHGIASSCTGSFTDLRTTALKDWRGLMATYGDRVLAFEHHTFSVGPIENAVNLARLLPRRARVHLVTHSTGGLVGDLLCLAGFDEDLIDRYWRVAPSVDDEIDPDRRQKLIESLQETYKEQRQMLGELRSVLRERELTIERYVRVACPARGTRLVGSHLDVFLSALLTVIGAVPILSGNLIYGAVKRMVLEIVRLRTDPRLVPGLEAILPDSPLGAFLAAVVPAARPKLAVIAGDVKGESLLQRLLLLVHDTISFQGVQNDVVVDTDSMNGGIAGSCPYDYLFLQGPRINHFHYFTDATIRAAFYSWFTARESPAAFQAIQPVSWIAPSADTLTQERGSHLFRSVGTAANALPVVVVVPDLMGCHLLDASTHQCLWFDPDLTAQKDSASLGDWEHTKVEAMVIDRFYGELQLHLCQSHRVEPFAYDWRQPLLPEEPEPRADSDRPSDQPPNVVGDLARLLGDLLKETRQPVRLLAHGSGGLLVRALAAKHAELWQRLTEREGARVLMLGSPHQGTYGTVETLLGKSRLAQQLLRRNGKEATKKLLEQLAQCPGVLQTLPRAAFAGPTPDSIGQWSPALLAAAVQGAQVAAPPDPNLLGQAGMGWDRMPVAAMRPALAQTPCLIAVHGQAALTPCGLTLRDGELRMLGTPQGDGLVTWASARSGVEAADYLLPVEHGSLPCTSTAFAALDDLLQVGSTTKLTRLASQTVAEGLQMCDVPPALLPTSAELLDSVLGAPSLREQQADGRVATALKVRCQAMDLRFVTQPVLVGHYEQDSIAGPEALIDQQLVNSQLTTRHQLGIYAGQLGTATVVLLDQTSEERLRDSYRGAVVTGLGQMGALTQSSLTEAVRVGALRYLLQILDRRGGELPDSEKIEAPLNALLLGSNSTTASNITIEDSLSCLIRGVMAANRQFRDAHPGGRVMVSMLDIVELNLDIALTAVKALQRVTDQLNKEDQLSDMQVEIDPILHTNGSYRHRLNASVGLGYWPRFVVTDSEALPPGSRRETAIARNISFARFGQLARVEATQQQRQPGLVESLVEKSISNQSYNENLARALFHLLVPHEFKELFRQADRMVMVLDERTANLPWEMMWDGDSPICLKQRMVRQLQSTNNRSIMSQALRYSAFVVGNPSTTGYNQVFRDVLNQEIGPIKSLHPLPGAEEEARTVVKLLYDAGFEIEESIGADQQAVDIVEKMFRRPYRVIHISAHGLFDKLTIFGDRRSGVVLSDGMLITAAEICSVEQVPDLVFLNCCHLARADRVDSESVPLNRLAASVATELIRMGVRVVLAAGWAVEDGVARFFTEKFYRELLANQPFGEAVFRARVATYQQYPGSTTWGAFQAYGDPSFVLDPNPVQRQSVEDAEPPANFAHQQELLQELKGLKVNLHVSSTQKVAVSGSVHLTEEQQLQAVLKRAQASWLSMPLVAASIADIYRELGPASYEHAREWYLRALCQDSHPFVSHDDSAAVAPISAIEQLAVIESQLGLDQWERGKNDGDQEMKKTGRDWMRSGINRLDQLLKMIDYPNSADVPTTTSILTTVQTSGYSDRKAMLGGAYKRQAVSFAQELQPDAATKNQPTIEEKLKTEKDFAKSLSKSIRYYKESGDDCYPRLNWLALQAIRDLDKPLKMQSAEIEIARSCADAARREYREKPTFWNAVIPADSLLTLHLLDRSLNKALNSVKLAYIEALEHVAATPSDRESVGGNLKNLIHLVEGMLSLSSFHAFPPTHDTELLKQAGSILGALKDLRELACTITLHLAPAEPAKDASAGVLIETKG
jgi:CHAT domain-containing protein/pimeloyl-ACP methyl ester carboxylesterase